MQDEKQTRRVRVTVEVEITASSDQAFLAASEDAAQRLALDAWIYDEESDSSYTIKTIGGNRSWEEIKP